MNTRLQRFDFGAMRDFRGPIPIHVTPADIEVALAPPPPPPSFNEAELEAVRHSAKAQGYQEGLIAGQSQARRDADQGQQNANETIQQFATKLEGLEQQYHDLLARQSAELSELVLVIAKKVAGEALETRSIETIAALVTGCLPVIFSRPRVIVELHPDSMTAAVDRIESLLLARGFEGDIQFRANASLGLHDTQLDWGLGQASRSTAALWQEIETLLTRIPLELTFQQTLNDHPTTGA